MNKENTAAALAGAPPGPYARALLDHFHGAADVAYTIHRDDGWSQVTPVAPAFAGPPFNPLEQTALELAGGRILDAGAGAGRHALWLQERGREVTALEIEPALVRMMAERGVGEALAGSIFTLAGRQFDTILMLMNGLGMVGTPAGMTAFFESAARLLAPGGQILCDSLDVRSTVNPVHLAWQEENRRHGRPPGQMRFWIEYRGRRGQPFDWLHLDFGALRDHAERHGWRAEWLASGENGRYLARLVRGEVGVQPSGDSGNLAQ